MSTTSKRGTIRRLVAAGAVATAIAAPLALVATPAHAVSSSGCTATPLRPVFAGFSESGTKRVHYSVRIACAADRSVFVQQRRMEDDAHPNADDLVGSTSFTRSFSEANTITVRVAANLPDTETGSEEVYHTVRFRVTSNGVTSTFTSREASPQQSMPN